MDESKWGTLIAEAGRKLEEVDKNIYIFIKIDDASVFMEEDDLI